MSYDLYMGDTLFPVTPSKITTKTDNRNERAELINETPINIIKDAGLTEISFDLLLPNVRYPFAKYPSGFRSAAYYVGILTGYKADKTPFRFILTRKTPDGRILNYTNMLVSLEDYSIEDDAGNGIDQSVSVTLLRYQPYGQKTLRVDTQNRVEEASGRPAKEPPKTWEIRRDETLSEIARAVYGDETKKEELYLANRELLEKEAKAHGRPSSAYGVFLYPGTVIRIP